MKWVKFLAITLTLSLTISAAAQGKKPGAWEKSKEAAQDKQAGQDVDRDRRDRERRDPIFTDRDRDIIRDYYRVNTSNLPPGLAKRGGKLPPGLQKQLEKNGQLPPGLQKRMTPFPADLERRLPRLPDIYQRGTIGSDVVIVDRKSQRVMDVIHDIFRK